MKYRAGPRQPEPFTTPEEVEQRLAERVRTLRLQRDWKQSTLASRAGVSVPTVRRYERTGRTTVKNLLRLCHALGRLDELADLLQPPPAASMAELEARAQAIAGAARKRGSK